MERELNIAKNHFYFAKEIDKGNAVYKYLNNETNELEPDLKVSELKGNIIAKEKLKQISEQLNYSDSEEIYQTLCKELL